MSIDLFSLSGRRILVTGGGRGLGRAMGQAMVDAGGDVALVSRTQDQVAEAAKEIGGNAVGVAGDIAAQDPATLVDIVEEALGGPIDVVLHAAGVQHRQAVEHFEHEAWDRVLNINLSAPFRLSQEIGARQLESQGSGSHIFTASITSLLMIQNVAAYTAAKSGLYGLTRAFSGEWSGSGIRANAIGPGYFRTEMTDTLFQDKEHCQKMLDRIPMGRFGDLKELSGAAVFLASEASSYVTGQLLMVDGGWTAS